MTTIVHASVQAPGTAAAGGGGGGAWDAESTRPVLRASGGSIGTGTTTAALALGGAGLAAAVAGGPIGARLGAAGIGRGIGIAVGVAALAGVGLLLLRGAGGGSTEYLVSFREQPDLDGVAPEDVYATLRAHHERNAPAVEQELSTLHAEGKVRSYSGIVGANGFVVDVVNRHRGEVEQRLGAVQQVGSIEAAPLG